MLRPVSLEMCCNFINGVLPMAERMLWLVFCGGLSLYEEMSVALDVEKHLRSMIGSEERSVLLVG
jgi:hypothetical protein